jgi:hypothetical protein
VASRQIVAVRMSGGDRHRHIAGVCYIVTSETPYKAYTATLEDVIAKLDDGQYFFTRDYDGSVAIVKAFETSDGTRFIRTVEDSKLTDNLLRLPRYEREREI